MPEVAADPVTHYAEAVVSGEIVAGRLVRLACERHLRDLERQEETGMRWVHEAAEHFFEFASYLILPTGEPFLLQPFQKFIYGCLFGWKGPDGYRRFRNAYIETGKGSGKTPGAALVGLYGLVADGEKAAEVYAAATTFDQANITFRDARVMAENSPALSRHLHIVERNISHGNSFFRPVSAEHKSLDGKRPHIGLVDELHEHPTPMVVDKIRAGTKNRKQALIFRITNAGHDRTTVCWAEREYSVKVLEGIQDDDAWFAYVCTLDPCEKCRDEGNTQPRDECPDCDQWTDEAVWEKANPGLDTILPRKYLREQVREARGMPSKENIVKRLNFCLWTQSATCAIPMHLWDAGVRKVDLASFKGRECFGGLDIGATSDFTAFVLLFPHDDAEEIEVKPAEGAPEDAPPLRFVRRSYTLVPFFWLPETPRRRDERTALQIEAWRRQKFLKTTPGNVVDYDMVLDDIVKLSKDFDIKKIAFDRGFQGSQMGTNLIKHFGWEQVQDVIQGILSMSTPFREFQELLLLGRLFNDGNPLMRWMASNTTAETRGGLVKPSKDTSPEKIDGITAATMALIPAMTAKLDDDNWYTPGCLTD